VLELDLVFFLQPKALAQNALQKVWLSDSSWTQWGSLQCCLRWLKGWDPRKGRGVELPKDIVFIQFLSFLGWVSGS